MTEHLEGMARAVRLPLPGGDALRVGTRLALNDVVGIEPWKSLLLYSLVRAGGLRNVVEVGVYKGSTTVWLAQAIADAGVDGLVHAVDKSEVPVAHALVETAGLSHFVQWHQGLSADVLPMLPDGIELAFVDGGHLYDDVKADINALLPKMKPGGILALDDVVPWAGCGGVYDAVIEFTAREALDILWVPTLPHPKREIRVGMALVQCGRPEEYNPSPDPRPEAR